MNRYKKTLLEMWKTLGIHTMYYKYIKNIHMACISFELYCYYHDIIVMTRKRELMTTGLR